MDQVALDRYRLFVFARINLIKTFFERMKKADNLRA